MIIGLFSRMRRRGAHGTEALLTMDDGRVERRPLTVEVVAKSFPTTQLHVGEKFVQLNKTDLARSQRESRETNAIYSRITTGIVPDEAFSDPIPGVGGTNFGERRIFNGEPRAPHSGADLHAAAGTPVHATNRGRATGRVTAPHLHWGMRVQGARVDPFSLVGRGVR